MGRATATPRRPEGLVPGLVIISLTTPCKGAPTPDGFGRVALFADWLEKDTGRHRAQVFRVEPRAFGASWRKDGWRVRFTFPLPRVRGGPKGVAP